MYNSIYTKNEPEQSFFDIAISWMQDYSPLILFVFITILLFVYTVLLKKKIEITKAMAFILTLVFVSSFLVVYAVFGSEAYTYYDGSIVFLPYKIIDKTLLLTEGVIFIYVMNLFYRMKK